MFQKPAKNVSKFLENVKKNRSNQRSVTHSIKTINILTGSDFFGSIESKQHPVVCTIENPREKQISQFKLNCEA